MYRDVNDYEMLYLICDSNDNDYNLMLKKYEPLIAKTFKKYKIVAKKMGYEEEDLLQIGFLALYNAINGYNGDKNNNLFYTYFIRILENTYSSLLKCNNTYKKRVLNESISYDNHFPDSELTYAEIFPDPNTLNIDYINDFGMRYINLKNSLEFDISCILDLKMEGFTNKEISILLDITSRKVINGIKEIKKSAIYF